MNVDNIQGEDLQKEGKDKTVDESAQNQPKISKVKRLNSSNPCFFFQHTDPIIKTKVQRYSLSNEKIERRKWTTFRLAFWKNAKNIRKSKLKEIEERERKLHYVNSKK